MHHLIDSLVSLAIGAAAGAGAMWMGLRRSKSPDKRSISTASFAQEPSTGLPSRSCDGTEKPDAAFSSIPLLAGLVEDDEIVQEQLTRNIQFFGREGQKKICESFVVVVGLGGVGSHAAHLLLRSGVGKIRLVDFDQVTLSSLNRHCLATRADVGLPKATCLERYFRAILPESQVEATVAMYTEETEDTILRGDPDFVLDAIDNIDTKVALLAACLRRGLPVLSVAATGGKADPTRLRFADISESAVDPLARAVRQKLRRNYGVTEGVTMLLSSEKQRCGLMYVDEKAATNPEEYQIIPNFRVRTMPVLGTTPATFGLAGAAWILCSLAEAPIVPEPHFRIPAKEIQTQHDRLVEREWEKYRQRRPGRHNTNSSRKKIRLGKVDDGGDTEPYGSIATAAAIGAEQSSDDASREEREGEDREDWTFGGADLAEVEILIRELWRGRSARSRTLPSNEMALTRGLGNLVLTRWDPSRDATVDNLVLLTMEEAEDHDAAVSTPMGLKDLKRNEPEFVQHVEKILDRARREFAYSYY